MENNHTNTHIFTNRDGNTLMREFEGVLSHNPSIKNLDAVVGFLRASGYFELRPFLNNIDKVRVLIGIDVDKYIAKAAKLGMLPRQADEEVKNDTLQLIKKDIEHSGYKKEIEDGIFQMVEDLKNGKLELRAHPSKMIHAKIYILYPENFSQYVSGIAITGSSNLSGNGLGISQDKQYEFNVKMSQYDDVKFAKEEFELLWAEAQGYEITTEDVHAEIAKTYLKDDVTPYEIYMKVLINVFGDQVEDDFTMELPDGVIDLKYQKDAMVQGYQMMMKHNGAFIADVVGLGKTVIATMIAKRFIEENGNKTKILVVYPSAVKENWVNTFKTFRIKENRNARFISNGSLSKVMDEKEEFDLVIVDEAHGFRHDSSGKYDDLQKICKAPCANQGALKLKKKKVLLLSATPINNSPKDLRNLLLLFQDGYASTIDGIPNLYARFAPWEREYDALMAERDKRNITEDVDKLYEKIREAVIDKVSIRRTRNNIINSPDYKADLDKQGIKFPTIEAPQALQYQMSPSTSALFYRTIHILSKDEDDQDYETLQMVLPQPLVLTYARYRAVEFLKSEYRRKYSNAPHIGKTLKGIYRVHMVKRLESSFYAFKKSLQSLLKSTENMLKMFEEDKVLIIPDLKVNEKIEQGLELDEIIEKALEKGYLKEDIFYSRDCFDPKFISMLQGDRDILKELIADWSKETGDPKFDTFRRGLEKDFFEDNESGKLVIFSESVDTLKYLFDRLTKDLNKIDVLMVTAKDRKPKNKKIKENFDANYKEQRNDFNIMLSSDVLAEGVNLHRSNIIINYDSPWNAIRLLQRIGRVNRIGTKAKRIHNFLFYPSQQGNSEIKLYQNALIKLQGFHSAFGEDAQIYSTEEIVRDFKLFNNNVKDSVDDKILFLREARELFNNSPELYRKIKNLPMKSRVFRQSDEHKEKAIVYVQSNVKTEFYETTEQSIQEIDFITAAKILKAEPKERPVPFNKESAHYELVNATVRHFCDSYNTQTDKLTVNKPNLSTPQKIAKKFVERINQTLPDDMILQEHCEKLLKLIELGRYNKLPKKIIEFMNKNDITSDPPSITEHQQIITEHITSLAMEYGGEAQQKTEPMTDPQIIISETFV